jgi:hypothetical protein
MAAVHCFRRSPHLSSAAQYCKTLTLAKLWISGGTVGTQYKVTVLMTSEGGRIDESELIFNIKDR